MPTTISFGLSVDEVRRAQQEIIRYKQELEIKNDLFVQKLTDVGLQVAKSKVIEKDAIYTGELEGSLSSVSSGNIGIIYTDCPWAVYVEFGTGIVGLENPHPNPDIVGWKYDTNEHGEKGWFYFKGNEWHWTKGMPSRPFMYETILELEDRIVSIAKEVFGT